MAFPPELSIMVVRQIAGSGAGIVGRGRGGRGWYTAAFDATQLYRGWQLKFRESDTAASVYSSLQC